MPLRVDKNKTFFTSDLHFGHKKLAEARGFSSIEEMDEDLIERWNSFALPNYTVFILGDFSFRNKAETCSIISRLVGTIKIVPGNHDNKNHLKFFEEAFKSRFEVIKPIVEIKVDEQLVILCHYPLLVWNKCHYGSWHLHGHSHGNLKPPDNNRRIDISIDACNDLMSYSKIENMMSCKSYNPHDQHTSNS